MQWWIYATATMLMFGVTNFLLKLAGYYHMDSVFASVILWLSVGLIGIVFLFYMVFTGEFQENMSHTSMIYLLLPMGAGIALAVGMYFLKIALSIGPAGPSIAIVMSNAFIVAILAYLLIGEKLSLWKIGGMLLIVVGILMMTLFE